jgi:aspartate racemase
LKDAGTTHLCMSCNTAHYSIQELEKEIKIPFINMVRKFSEKIVSFFPNFNIGLIASDGCLMGQVYEREFQSFSLTDKIIYLNVDFQKEVTKGICNVKKYKSFFT